MYTCVGHELITSHTSSCEAIHYSTAHEGSTLQFSSRNRNERLLQQEGHSTPWACVDEIHARHQTHKSIQAKHHLVLECCDKNGYIIERGCEERTCVAPAAVCLKTDAHRCRQCAHGRVCMATMQKTLLKGSIQLWSTSFKRHRVHAAITAPASWPLIISMAKRACVPPHGSCSCCSFPSCWSFTASSSRLMSSAPMMVDSASSALRLIFRPGPACNQSTCACRCMDGWCRMSCSGNACRTTI